MAKNKFCTCGTYFWWRYVACNCVSWNTIKCIYLYIYVCIYPYCSYIFFTHISVLPNDCWRAFLYFNTNLERFDCHVACLFRLCRSYECLSIQPEMKNSTRFHSRHIRIFVFLFIFLQTRFTARDIFYITY